MKKIMLATLFGLAIAACGNNKKQCAQNDNPLLCSYNTPFGVPPFDKIKVEHFLPALDEGVKQQDAIVDSIISDTAEPDFENVIVALEYSSELFDRVCITFDNLKSCNGTDDIIAIAEDMVSKAENHRNKILMNPELFKKIKAVYDKRNSLKLNQEQKQLLEKTYQNFVRGGANLNENQKKRLSEINNQISLLELDFENKVRAETNAFELVLDKADCEGLPQPTIDAAAALATERGMSGKYVFTLDKPSITPFLQNAKKRDLREKIFKAYISRCDTGNANDTKANIAKQVSLRTEKAQLFGYKNYAEYTLADKMAKTPEAAMNLLAQIWTPALKLAKREAADIQQMIFESGEKFKLQPWDWNYYAERVRIAKYDLNEDMLLPYFSLNNVLQGVLDVANKLYGLKFIKHTDIPVYHPDAIAYEVRDADDSYLGVLYFDFFPRATKGVGAWMTEFRTQHKIFDKSTATWKDVRPIVSIVCNFSKPTNDAPALLNLDEVCTLFHEFGHALNGMLSQCTYPSLAGTNTPTDFVELPSQVMENWALLPEVMNMYAHNYKTGEPISTQLVDKIRQSIKFNQGFNNVEFLSAAILDMKYHMRSDTTAIADIDEFEKQTLDSIGMMPQIVPRYRSTYFKHAFVWGYTAGYYSYRWSAVLDADAFEAFIEHGYFDEKTATAFRKNILERGGTDDPMKMYVAFRGHQPSVDALLKREGLE